MRLLELELQNFRQYAQAVVAFETGITAIVGPNGAGKTTLVEAILWALYGTTAARGTSDTLRFLWSEGGARVQVRLEFQLGNARYQVVRTEKDASLSQWRNGVLSTLARGVRPVTESVHKLLGMTLHQFQTSFCARQKELEFMSYAPERRREEISRMLGYERIGKALDAIAQHAKSLGDEIKGLQQGLGHRELLEQQISQTQQTIAACERELASLNEQHTHAQAALQEATHLLQEAQLKSRPTMPCSTKSSSSSTSARVSKRSSNGCARNGTTSSKPNGDCANCSPPCNAIKPCRNGSASWRNSPKASSSVPPYKPTSSNSSARSRRCSANWRTTTRKSNGCNSFSPLCNERNRSKRNSNGCVSKPSKPPNAPDSKPN
jgi:DNA repair exonuclease SbcCD ATPase subunit